MARKLRIAASVFFGVATVALCLLSVKSFVTFDRIVWQYTDCIQLISYRGKFYTILMKGHYVSNSYWQSGPARLEPEYNFTPWDGPSYFGFAWINRGRFNAMPNSEFLGLQYGLVGRSWTSTVDGIIVPYYSLIAVATVSTFLSCRWSHWPRFSLRTLLIAMTLVAVALGLSVWHAP